MREQHCRRSRGRCAGAGAGAAGVRARPEVGVNFDVSEIHNSVLEKFTPTEGTYATLSHF